MTKPSKKEYGRWGGATPVTFLDAKKSSSKKKSGKKGKK